MDVEVLYHFWWDIMYQKEESYDLNNSSELGIQ